MGPGTAGATERMLIPPLASSCCRSQEESKAATAWESIPHNTSHVNRRHVCDRHVQQRRVSHAFTKSTIPSSLLNLQDLDMTDVLHLSPTCVSSKILEVAEALIGPCSCVAAAPPPFRPAFLLFLLGAGCFGCCGACSHSRARLGSSRRACLSLPWSEAQTTSSMILKP
jgi:hypothetical protein